MANTDMVFAVTSPSPSLSMSSQFCRRRYGKLDYLTCSNHKPPAVGLVDLADGVVRGLDLPGGYFAGSGVFWMCLRKLLRAWTNIMPRAALMKHGAANAKIDTLIQY